jgi:hypothetical protein
VVRGVKTWAAELYDRGGAELSSGPAHAVPQLAQFDLQPAGVIAAVMVIKHVDHHPFPSGRGFRFQALAPYVVATMHDVEYLTEELHWIVKSVLINKLHLAHGIWAVEKIVMTFLKSTATAPVVC